MLGVKHLPEANMQADDTSCTVRMVDRTYNLLVHQGNNMTKNQIFILKIEPMTTTGNR